MTERDIKQLAFGDVPSEEAARNRRDRKRRAKPIENQEVFDVYRLSPLIQEAVLADARSYREGRGKYRAQTESVLQKAWGENVTMPSYFHPSVVSRCLRWAGYEALADELNIKPAPRTFEAEMGMKLGSAAHYSLLRVLKKFGIQEQTVIHDNPGISGRLDFMIRNPVTEEYQVMDLKFPGDFAFSKVKRQGLPDYLAKTKGIYNPNPEDRLQLLLYMQAKRNEGFDVTIGNLVYINRNNGKIKECIVPWDEIAEHDMEIFNIKMKEANEAINRGELPEPTVVSTHICGSFCSYRLHCEYGQEFAAGRVKSEKKRRPRGVYLKARKDAEARKERLERLGIVQAELPLEIPETNKDSSVKSSSAKSSTSKSEGKGRKENIYHLGTTQELEGLFCHGCGRNLTRTCIKIGDRRGAKVRIKIETRCPTDGLLDTKEETVLQAQVVE